MDMKINKKKILIISGEAWRDESNGGNVLTNLFEPLIDEFEFAQIYTNPAMPSNNVCNKYFHISEADMIGSVIKRKFFGRTLREEEYNNKRSEYNVGIGSSRLVNILKKYFLSPLYLLQDILWRISLWKSPALKNFIEDYNPDIIFAPMYYSLHLHRLDRYVAKITGKKIISYVSDDHLTFRQFSLSPFFWFNRLLLRLNVLKTSKNYSLLYTMTKEQLEEYEPVLKVPMKILKKTKSFQILPEYILPAENEVIKIVYAGNLIYNRYKTLANLAESIVLYNKKKIRFQLHIYTQTSISKEMRDLLHDGVQIFLHGKVTMEDLNLIYSDSDILLHVESFDLKQKLITRLSFSTKIIDLIHSGRSILAICWSQSSPFKYLSENDIAICASEDDNLYDVLENIDKNPKILEKYSKKSWLFGSKNHQESIVIENFKKDFNNAN